MLTVAAVTSSSCVGHGHSTSSPGPETLNCCAHQQPSPLTECLFTAATIEVATFAHAPCMFCITCQQEPAIFKQEPCRAGQCGANLTVGSLAESRTLGTGVFIAM